MLAGVGKADEEDDSSNIIQTNDGSGAVGEISFDALQKNIPLTEEQLKTSNEKIQDAYFTNGIVFQNQLEDYFSAIDSYEMLNKRFPANRHLDEALFNLYYCYLKTGKTSSADSAKKCFTLY